MPRFAAILIAAAPLCLALSCATRDASVPPPAAVTPYPSAAFPQTPEPAGLETLAGRSICIDPGHGGPWPGAVAPSNGLRESDANLQVALRLADILREAGAAAVLTRTADNALVADNMSEDLAARARFVNASGAEIFLSIHHNADIVPNSGRDDLEMYYAMHDDGASRDLAEALTAAMARGFRSDAARKLLLPGNYKVLRLSERPAVLLETGYMTHDATAARLANPAGIDAEARSIARGLAVYFALDPPVVARAEAAALDTGRHRIDIAFANQAAIVPASVDCRINGEAAAGIVESEPGRVAFHPAQPLPNGAVELRIRGRNIHGAAFTHRLEIDVDRPAASLIVHQRPEAPAEDSGAVVEWEILAFDALGLPVKDGANVTLNPGARTTTTTNGRAFFYSPANALPQRIAVSSGAASAERAVQTGNVPFRSVRILDELTGSPVAAALAGGYITSGGGWAALEPGGGAIPVTAPGYVPKSESVAGHRDIVLSPESRALLGRRIVIDPIDGGRQPGAIGPFGARASDRALAAATALAARLRNAGADVLLLRTGDTEMGELTRVMAAEAHRPELYIAVTYGLDPNRARLMNPQGNQIDPPPAFVAHYPGSAAGRRVGEAAGAALGVSRIVSTVYYPVQQVSCPAILVQPASIHNEGASAAEAMNHGERLYAGVEAYFRGVTAR